MKRHILLILVTFVIGGCAAALVPYTSNPNEKLLWSQYLIEKGRALPAERLIMEAITICQDNNDSLCLGDAYAQYALFFRSYAVERYEKRYTENGFDHKNATYKGRFTQSKKYYDKAIVEFLKINKYDRLTNAYAMLGRTYYFLKNKKLECKSYDTSVLYHEKFSKENPNAKIVLPKEFSTYKEYIKSEKRQSECSKGDEKNYRRMLGLER